MNNLFLSSGYNGAFQINTLDIVASYDRWYLQMQSGQNDLIVALHQINLHTFEDSKASRMVVNFSGEISDIELIQNAAMEKGLELTSHQEHLDNKHHIYFEKNKQDRAIPKDIKIEILTSIQNNLKKYNTLPEIEHQRGVLKSQEYTLEKCSNKLSGKDIENIKYLRNHNFAMDEQTILSILGNNPVYIMRHQGNIIGICMLSGEESTEWVIHDQYQHQGLMKHLLNYAHSEIILQDPSINIYAECRRPNSYKSALSACMVPANKQAGLLTNNVAIQGIPDDRNINTKFDNFRTCIPMYIPDNFKENSKFYNNIYQ